MRKKAEDGTLLEMYLKTKDTNYTQKLRIAHSTYLLAPILYYSPYGGIWAMPDKDKRVGLNHVFRRGTVQLVPNKDIGGSQPTEASDY